MKTPHSRFIILAVALLALATASILRFGHSSRTLEGRSMSSREEIPLDYFLETKSFSEVENTKALLDALAAQSISALRTRFEAQAGARNRATIAAAALQELESRLAEFTGTEQEYILVNEQLLLLFQSGQPDRWLDVYLNTVYERPTLELVGRQAKRALEVARQIGREDELWAAFHHVLSIPRPFEAKDRVQAVLPLDRIASGSDHIRHTVL